MNNSNVKNVKKLLIITLPLIVMNLLLGCNKSESANIKNETIIENCNYDFNDAIQKAKCVTEYPDTATVDDFDTVKFGKYEQDGDESNGAEDIEWIVLNKFNGKAKLISKYILDNIAYTYVYDENAYKWEISNLRQWLNNIFYNIAFDDNEKNLIDNYCTIRRKTNSIFDKVFCLNVEEYEEINCITQIDTYATTYAKNVINGGEKIEIDNLYSESKGHSPYYTMIPCTMYGNALYYVSPIDGFCGDGLGTSGIGVRPVIVVNYDDIILNDDIQEINNETINKNKTIDIKKLKIELNKISKINPVKEYVESNKIDECPSIKIGKYKKESEDEYDDIEWLLLEKNEVDGKALLLSKYILNNKCYNDFLEEKLTWEESSLRQYLNTIFYDNVYNDVEKKAIISQEIENFADRPIGNGPGSEPVEYGNKTDDEIFILSINDLYKYFNHEWHEDDKNIMAMPTRYAKNNTKLIMDSSNAYCCYWVRDIGTNDLFASYVTESGCEYAMTFVNTRNIGIRPAMWVKYK